MNNEKRNELNKVIRAVLIAKKPPGMTMRDLEYRYSEIEGKPMPLFGYPDSVALLKSLTDTVSMVCYSQCTWLFCIRLIALF